MDYRDDPTTTNYPHYTYCSILYTPPQQHQQHLTLPSTYPSEKYYSYSDPPSYKNRDKYSSAPPHSPRPQPIPQKNTTLTLILPLTKTEINTRQPRHTHQRVHKHLRPPEPLEELHILYLNTKHLAHCRVPRIVLKRCRGELHHGEGAEQHQRDVEHEGGHVGLPDFHGVQLKEYKIEPELEAAFEGAEEEVHG